MGELACEKEGSALFLVSKIKIDWIILIY
jgi:hypothetical protein